MRMTQQDNFTGYKPVLVQLKVDNDNVAWVDANGDGSTIGLVALDTVYVNNPLLAVNLGDLSFPALVLAPDNSDFVILADRD